VDRLYPLAVLDGEGRDHREAIGPQEGGHLQILLQARPGAGVGAAIIKTVFMGYNLRPCARQRLASATSSRR